MDIEITTPHVLLITMQDEVIGCKDGDNIGDGVCGS